MAKNYFEDKSGAKFPLNYTFDGVNNFVFSTGVSFEDLQALCLGLVAKLEAAQQLRAVDLRQRAPRKNKNVSGANH